MSDTGRRRVVITGLGIISPVGNQVDTAWQAVLSGQSGIGMITRFDPKHETMGTPSHIAGEVKDFSVVDWVPAKEARHMDIFMHYGIAAGIQAVRDAGLEDMQGLDRNRVGVNVGSGIGGLPMIEGMYKTMQERGTRRISPFFIPATIINMISGHLAIRYQVGGPNLSCVTACATGNHCIGESARLIEYGDVDVMITGGAESSITALTVGGFSAARALSLQNERPEVASRPWDKDRDGFVLGEGAGIVVLEEYESARSRGARIYCELAGYGLTGDGYHITAPREDGDGACRAIQMALRNARLNPDEIQYINAHGTSTPLGDLAETRAVKKAMGTQSQHLVMSSTKSMTGHLLGAAGGIEAVFSALSVYHQKIPPTINLDNPSPDCDLDYCAHTARDWTIHAALSNSFGFGGTNSSLAFKRI